MTKDNLIAKQQIQIEEFKEEAEIMREDFREIWMILCAVGAPLNDNILNFSKEQMEPLFTIKKIAEYHL